MYGGAHLDEIVILLSGDGEREAIRPYEGAVAAGRGRGSVVAQLPSLAFSHHEVRGRC